MASIIFGSGGTSTPATASVNATADQTTLGSVTLGLTDRKSVV
jgi:hypothetical protein